MLHKLFLSQYNRQASVTMLEVTRSIDLSYKFETEIFEELLNIYITECFEKEISAEGFRAIVQSNDESINPLLGKYNLTFPILNAQMQGYFEAMINARTRAEKAAIIAQYRAAPYNFLITNNGRMVGYLKKKVFFDNETVWLTLIHYPRVEFSGPINVLELSKLFDERIKSHLENSFSYPRNSIRFMAF